MKWFLMLLVLAAGLFCLLPEGAAAADHGDGVEYVAYQGGACADGSGSAGTASQRRGFAGRRPVRNFAAAVRERRPVRRFVGRLFRRCG